MGLFGGDSTSVTENKTFQTDNRRVIDAGGISAEDSTVNVLDGGAIARAFDFASKTTVQAQQSITSTANLVSDAYAEAKGRGAMTDYIIIGALALAGLVAVQALRK